MSDQPSNPRDLEMATWYAGGLRFSCRDECAACCKNHGEYSYVYLEDEDVECLAAYLGLDPPTFLARYTESERQWIVLRNDRPECIFLDGNRCTVYEARPIQCSTFPFWRENVRTPRTWEQIGRFCPGVGEGEHHGPDHIEQRLAEREISS